MPREEWARERPGEENEPAVAEIDRAEQREVVFGQTCPIETAVGVARQLEGNTMADGGEDALRWGAGLSPPPRLKAETILEACDSREASSYSRLLDSQSDGFQEAWLKLPGGVVGSKSNVLSSSAINSSRMIQQGESNPAHRHSILVMASDSRSGAGNSDVIGNRTTAFGMATLPTTTQASHALPPDPLPPAAWRLHR